VTFRTLKEHREGLEYIKKALRLVRINNILYRRGLRPGLKDLQEFSHLSEPEFARRYLGLLPLIEGYDRKRRAALDAGTCSSIPQTKDWRALGKVPQVRSQMECGSCYIFSAVAAIESAYAIEYGVAPPKLSRQHLLNCITDPDTGGPNGCTGGRPEWVWKFSKQEGGLVAEKDEPYTGVPGPCRKDLPKVPYTEVDYYEKIPFSGSAEDVEEQIRCRLATTGPFHIGLTVRKNDMGSFKSGVFKNTDGICESSENINHALFLVGYGEKLLPGDRTPTKHWIIQNSWGSRWGEDGFLNVERGKNVCGFATDGHFIVLKKDLKPYNLEKVCNETQSVGSRTLCVIIEEKTYEEAQNFCLQNGMRLFRARMNGDLQSLLNFANSKWEDLEDFTPFIDGIESNACKSIAKEDEGYSVDDETDCADRLPSICEFRN
jgi:hypothetical protein